MAFKKWHHHMILYDPKNVLSDYLKIFVESNKSNRM